MTRVYHTFEVEDSSIIKQQMLAWASQFNICCFLDNQQYNSTYNSFECLLGVGATSLFTPQEDFFSSLNSFINFNNDWIFAHFNYELKDNIDGNSLERIERNGFPDYFLFVPELIIILQNDLLKIGVVGQNASSIFLEVTEKVPLAPVSQVVSFNPLIWRNQYLNCVSKLKEHIHKGDCYEINFCQKFRANADIDPVSTYSRLAKISSNPFSAFYRVGDNYLLSASPERYLKKVGEKIITQPIKGTSSRSTNSVKEDELSKNELKNSAKDQSENVMIVDLVRNDLSKICREGSVGVEELFGVYSFPQVHQMISTVTGNLEENTTFSDVLKATFPMGSMTGAPKKKVMELIKKYESSLRGIYSGTVGYFTPEKDFDFNVVIRSIVYNKTSHNISFHTGSAITANSEPEKEYEECLLKARAILQVFSENENRPNNEMLL